MLKISTWQNLSILFVISISKELLKSPHSCEKAWFKISISFSNNYTSSRKQQWCSINNPKRLKHRKGTKTIHWRTVFQKKLPLDVVCRITLANWIWSLVPVWVCFFYRGWSGAKGLEILKSKGFVLWWLVPNWRLL